MKKLSTGQDSTLEEYLTLCRALFGEKSWATVYVRDRIDAQGKATQVLAPEQQMLAFLAELDKKATD